ncbi:FMN-binding protein [Rhodopirellula sp. MGV]|uniref:FMN-binding protein n=1 Tax=Rhodopirellula sp. MGV TaxID=2023130 RepID=UPI001304E159|nr:FMN-binding protein [Rhodopirellula sp. MGV]
MQSILPEVFSIEPTADAEGFWQAFDSNRQAIARVGRTLPAANDVIGYRGPTEALVVIDAEFNLLGVRLINSADTKEHVNAVRLATDFFDQFREWRFDDSGSQESPSKPEIDAVSGATLTSLALAKGVMARIGGSRQSLVFPEPIEVDEISDWFPKADYITNSNYSAAVYDAENQRIGQVLRSGAFTDSIAGYQGPTELLFRIRDDNRSNAKDVIIEAIKIRSSFDNEPYVRYCRMERSFWKKFTGQTRRHLAGMTLEQSGVEGVSGATMTSLAIAETVYQTCECWNEQQRLETERQRDRTTLWGRMTHSRIGKWGNDVRLSNAGFACILLMIGLGTVKRLGWFRKRWFRRVWLVTVVVVVGFWSGNMLSMSLIAGWAGEGIAWRLAPGLALIALIALVGPAAGKSNPYCNHVCPHGALQQLIRPSQHSSRRIKLNRKLAWMMTMIPGCSLTIAYLTLLFYPTVELANWEPFHAYLFRLAPTVSIAFAVATLVASAWIPMGYCRYGCPTGRLIEYLRRRATGHRLTVSDGTAIVLLAVALSVRLSG